ncbi:hypothetical protein [Dyadobacter diqingensis]|uniref:hypothetical protein n=1 Tax=Dyadobacter diqingensis TaxID=2938121 RepID=UPI0020C1F277|nr:hypothetical protein [Dyadobacter diqingensis]
MKKNLSARSPPGNSLSATLIKKSHLSSHNSMKKILILLAFLFFSISCQNKDEKIIDNATSRNDFDISQVKSGYENEMLITSKNARKTAGDKSESTTKRKLDWSKSYTQTLGGIKRLIVPFTLEQEIYLKRADSSVVAYSETTWFTVSKKNDKYVYEIVTKIPDRDWLEGKTERYSGQVIVEDVQGNFLRGYYAKNGWLRDILKGDAKARTNETVCAWTQWFTCVSFGTSWMMCTFTHNSDVSCIEKEDEDHGIGFYQGPDGNWLGGLGECVVCPNSGSSTYQPTDESPRPGDNICKGTFPFSGDKTGSFYLLNVTGLTFENGATANVKNNMVYSLTNGITDAAMNTSPAFDYFGQSKKPIQYVAEVFPDLFVSRDISSAIVGGTKVWQFTPKAARAIATYATGLAGIGVRGEVPYAATPGNTAAWAAFEAQSTNIIRSLMPGSRIYQGYAANGATAPAIYAPNCQ